MKKIIIAISALALAFVNVARADFTMSGYQEFFAGSADQSTASGAYTAANIIANLQTLTADMAANVPAILGKDDLRIYMNNKYIAW